MNQYAGLLLWTAIGLVPLTGAGLLLWRDHSFQQRSVATQGEVSSITDEYYRGERRYRATIEWKDREGKSHAYDAFAGSAGSYGLGQAIPLRYDPAVPDDVRGDGWPWAAIVLGIIGAVFLSISGRELVRKPS